MVTDTGIVYGGAVTTGHNNEALYISSTGTLASEPAFTYVASTNTLTADHVDALNYSINTELVLQQDNMIQNLAVGRSAGFGASVGSSTNVGALAGVVEGVGAGFNVNVGTQAGQHITSGQNNINIGFQTGTTLVSGGGNTLVGTGADVTGASVTSATAIGVGSAAGDSGIALGGVTAAANEFAIANAITNWKFQGDSYVLPTASTDGYLKNTAGTWTWSDIVPGAIVGTVDQIPYYDSVTGVLTGDAGFRRENDNNFKTTITATDGTTQDATLVMEAAVATLSVAESGTGSQTAIQVASSSGALIQSVNGSTSVLSQITLNHDDPIELTVNYQDGNSGALTIQGDGGAASSWTYELTNDDSTSILIGPLGGNIGVHIGAADGPSLGALQSNAYILEDYIQLRHGETAGLDNNLTLDSTGVNITVSDTTPQSTAVSTLPTGFSAITNNGTNVASMGINSGDGQIDFAGNNGVASASFSIHTDGTASIFNTTDGTETTNISIEPGIYALTTVTNVTGVRLDDTNQTFKIDSKIGSNQVNGLSLNWATDSYYLGDNNAGSNGTYAIVNNNARSFDVKGVYNSLQDSSLLSLSFGSGIVTIGDVSGSNNGTVVTVKDDDSDRSITLAGTIIEANVLVSGFGSDVDFSTGLNGRSAIYFSGGTGTPTASLPTGVIAPIGTKITIGDLDGIASANNITIDAGASNTITGATSAQTYVLTLDGEVITLQKITATKWKVI